MSETKIDLVEPQTLSIYLPSIGAPVTIRTESDEVLVVVRFAIRPRDNVVKVDLDVSTGGNGASVPSLDKDTPADFSR